MKNALLETIQIFHEKLFKIHLVLYAVGVGVVKAPRPDVRTAIVTLTHDPKLDDAALEVALSSEAFYIGSLGSKKTHRARLNRLERLGFDKAACERIHGPVGLAIGAKSPAEIAVAILAEVTQARHIATTSVTS